MNKKLFYLILILLQIFSCEKNTPTIQVPKSSSSSVDSAPKTTPFISTKVKNVPKTKPLIPTNKEIWPKAISIDVDLQEYPTKINLWAQNQDIVIGDMHANTIKFINFLIREGILELDNSLDRAEKKYRILYLIYSKKEIKFADILDFYNILKDATIALSAPRIILIGDDLCDRGTNDILTLLLYEKISNKLSYAINLSNHSLGFLSVYEQNMLRNFSGPIDPRLSPCISLEKLYKSINSTPDPSEIKSRILKIIKENYLPFLNLIGYTIDEKNKIFSIYSHAPIGLSNITNIAQKYALDCGNIRENHTKLKNCIDMINNYFHQSIKHDKLLFSNINNQTLHSDPIYYLVWNRDYSGLDRDKKLGDGYSIIWIHGHDKSEREKPENAIDLDNYLGAGPGREKGTYNIYVAPLLP